jgi:hypothetical protein
MEASTIWAARLGFNASIPEQCNIPQRIGARTLFSEARIMLEAVHRGRALFEIAAGEIDLDGGGTHAQIV